MFENKHNSVYYKKRRKESLIKQQILAISIAVGLTLLESHAEACGASCVAALRRAAEAEAQLSVQRERQERMGVGKKRERRMSTVKVDLGKKILTEKLTD